MLSLTDKKLLMLRPAEIVSGANLTRKIFDDQKLKQLTESIASSGLIQPLIIRKNNYGEYELIAGERRLRAAKAAGLRRVPCILQHADDMNASMISMIENLQRSELSCIEEAEAIARIIGMYSLSQTEVASRLGISQSSISNKLRLLKLSDGIKSRIISAGLDECHARVLLRLPEHQRPEALEKIIAEDLSIRQTTLLIEGMLNPESACETGQSEEKFQPVRKVAIGDVRLFSNSLSKLLDTMKNAGIDAYSRRHETDKYIEFKVRINKNVNTENYRQLKIC